MSHWRGFDFSGKTTAIHLLQDWLTSKSIESILTKHPGATWVGQKIRELVKDPESKIDARSRAMLFAVDNSAFQEEFAKPLALTDKWLLADRNNFTSALAYQAADGLNLSEIAQLHSSLINPRKIDHVFVLDITWETRCKRKNYRDETQGIMNDYYERDKEHFNKLRNAYLTLQDHSDILHKYVNGNNKLNISIIDANVDGPAIVEQIKTILNEYANIK